MIIAVLTVVFVAALTAQVMVLRNTVIEERRTKVFDLVEAAKKILSNYEEKAKAGKISAEEARQLAFDAIGACAGVNPLTISESTAPAAPMPALPMCTPTRNTSMSIAGITKTIRASC
jgi:Cache domain.